MSKKEKQPIFCETQCSDGDDDDYIDKLIKQKGAQALNTLLKDQDYFESEIDKQEIIELRDSLAAPYLQQNEQQQQKPQQTNLNNVHSYSDQNLVASQFNPQIDDSKTPKNIVRYHKRKQTDCGDSSSSASWNQIQQKNYTNSSQPLKLNSKQTSLQEQDNHYQIPNDLPGLEHQDTIVRQPSTTSSNISTNQDSLTKFLIQAVSYFGQTHYPEVSQQISMKPNEAVQKQLIKENDDLKKQIIKLHQQVYKLKGQSKQLKKDAISQRETTKQQTQNEHYDMIVDLQQKVSDLQIQLQEMHGLYQKEKIDKEHTTIAYKRFLQKIEKQKQQTRQENNALSNMMYLQQSNTYVQNSSANNLLRKSPSPPPHRNMANNNGSINKSLQDMNASPAQQLLIYQMQQEIARKDQELSYLKSQRNSSSVHLNSEENVLDDLDDEDRYLEDTNQYYQLTNNSEMTPYKQGNNLQADFGGQKYMKTSQNLQAQQFYSYEKRPQSPGLSNMHISQIPTSSTVLTSSLYAERPQSPLNTHQAFRTQNPSLHNPQHLTTSSYSSQNSGSFLKQHHAQLISNNHSPMHVQQQQRSRGNNANINQQSLAFQVSTGGSQQQQNLQNQQKKHSQQLQLQQRLSGENELKRKANNNVGGGYGGQEALGFRQQKQQYLMTQSSGSSGIGGEFMMSHSHHPLMSVPVNHGVSDDDEEL